MLIAILLAFVPIVLQQPAGGAAPATYRVNPNASRATIHVGKSGAFSFVAGHTHQVSGPVQSGSIDLDAATPSRSRVQLTIATADLKVESSGEPEGDAPKVQETMDSDKVLDVAQFPRITFTSTAVALKDRRGGAFDFTVTGRLTIRDVTQNVTAPVHVEANGGTLTGAGRFSVKQSAFGIKPISVGGVVAVKDGLDIEFSITAAK